jgi:glycosyltransferase involved in cell wall biosynthesis
VSRTKVISLVEAQVVTGPAKNVLRFAGECRDRVDLTIVTFVRASDKRSQPAPYNAFISEVRRLNLPLEIIWETGPFDLSVLTSLRQIFERHKADIVQTHSVKSHFLVSLLRERPFRWIAFHHGYTSENLKVHIYNQFDRWSLRACDCVVTVCAEFACRLAHRGSRRDRIFVVHNSVEPDFACRNDMLSQETRQRFLISGDELVILAVGRLSPEKGHCYLIDGIAKIISSSPHLKPKVLIAGEGPAEGKLRAQVVKRGLEKYVKLIGQCSDVAPLFSIADVFVLPSLSEGSPNVLLESMAARVPIVATNVGGVSEIVSDGESATLVPPANADMLGKSILAVLVDRSRAKQYASVAFDRARLMFNPTMYNDRILNIYDTLLCRVSHNPAPVIRPIHTEMAD